MLLKLTSSTSGGPQETASLYSVFNVWDGESAEAPAILYNSLIFLFISCLATSLHWLHGLNLVHSCNIKRQGNVSEEMNLVSSTVDSFFFFQCNFPWNKNAFIFSQEKRPSLCLLSKYFALQLSRCSRCLLKLSLFNS